MSDSGSPLKQNKDAIERAATRFSRWQRRLLDLSLHNRLLNFKPTRRSLEFCCPDPVALNERLAAGASIKIIPKPQSSDDEREEPESADQRIDGQNILHRYAGEALQRNEVVADLERVDLATRLVELYRTARTDVQEGGANTLYLVLGFLVWRRDDRGYRKFRAPLILVPVTLQRRSVRSGVRMDLHEDEPRFNTTLLEMLRQDFGLEISGLDESLSGDDRGMDIAHIWDRVRLEIDGVDDFEVVEDVVLGTFSFAKYLMWKDLVDRSAQLMSNGVVRRLIDSPRQQIPSEACFPEPRRLDKDYPPERLFTALPADSSQLSAVAACANQKDFVLIGPPGTGKSQTIANMIAHNLAEGRTVLFVSEKIAALDVVYRRLRDVDLGEFCLELHSNKARKVDVLEQLRESWNSQEDFEESEWYRKAHRLRGLRESLNLYVERIHKRYRNGLTPFHAMGQAASDVEQPCVELSWPSVDAHDDVALARLRDIARRMDTYAVEAGRVTDSAFDAIYRSDWSPAWQRSLVNAASSVAAAASAARERIASFFGALRINEQKLTLDQLRALKLLAEALPYAYRREVSFAMGRKALETVAALDRGLELVCEYRKIEKRLARTCVGQHRRPVGAGGQSAPWQDARSSWWPSSESVRRKIRNAMIAQGAVSGRSDYEQDLKLLWRLQSVGKEINELNPLLETVSSWRGIETTVAPLKRDLHLAKRLLYAIASLGADQKSLIDIHLSVGELVSGGNDLLGSNAAVGRVCAALTESLQKLERAIEDFSTIAEANAYERVRSAAGEDWLERLKKVANDLFANEAKLNAWCAWRRIRRDAIRAELGSLVGAVERGELDPGRISRCFETSYCRWWVSAVVQEDPVLRTFHSSERNDRIGEFRHLDNEFTELTRRCIRARMCAGLAEEDPTQRAAEFGTLRRELEKKTRHKPVRQLISEIPSALTRLTPCLLMSPLSVAQYLTPDQSIFDLVIFDEASQITVWDAVGAIARGKQTIVVGDPKQLPPTSFFSRSDDESDESDEFEGDLQSILDECLGAGLPAQNLAWHYRSEHESLIAFSNHRYYAGELITFPSPFTFDRAVRRIHVPDGVYGRGGTRTNRVEAKTVVAAVVQRLKNPSFAASKRSIGVVTFNVEQQRLIEDLLDEERIKDSSIERYFSDDQFEALFVKNLESVQGDERDVILFSVTFGPDIDGHISMNFGPLNREGGERRLNVAITRARSELLVFTTLRSEQIDLSRTRGAGVKDFKNFLQFAERGSRSLAESIYGSVGEYASSLESAVARSLSERGWVVHPQIGVSAFRIGIGVVHPDSPGRYLAGIECDGENYHCSATARDRDKLREEILGRVGWNILRIWSIDWWIDHKGAADKLDSSLNTLLERARAEAEAENAASLHEPFPVPAEQDPDLQFASQANLLTASESQNLDRGEFATRLTADGLEGGSLTAGDSAAVGVTNSYRVSDPTETLSPIDPENFFDRAQDDAVQRMIDFIVAAEGPLRDDVLVKRVVRVHGFKRTGRKLRDRVLDLATSRYETTTDPGGMFFWPDGVSPDQWSAFRAPLSEEDFRSASEICFEELAVLARQIVAIGAEDPAREMALAMGLSRIDSATRHRLEEVLSQLSE